MLLEGKMGHTNRSVQKFTRWAWAAAMTWPGMGMGSAAPGHRWNWTWTDWQQHNSTTGNSHHSNSTEVGKTHSSQMCGCHFRLKLCWNASATSWKGFGGVTLSHGEVRSSSSSTQHHGSSRECLDLWLQPKDNSPGLSLWTAECCPGRHRKPLHILDNSETNTQTQTLAIVRQGQAQGGGNKYLFPWHQIVSMTEW